MIKKPRHIILVILFASFNSYGQLSPGDLSQAHADLEGMSNCTLCHDLGDKVSNKKCLDCHDDIQSLINITKGYHANSSVLKKDCFECHSDHHGRKFDMKRFDESKFRHSEAGYTLEGKHETIDCRDCHNPDFIEDEKIAKRKSTFLGLDDKCLSCHDDFHQETLEINCLSCHEMDAFSPASKFDHNNAEYKLSGEHLLVDCIKCHETTVKNGKNFQNFRDVAFNDCISCHDDPHNAAIKGDCNQCHSETSFNSFIGRGNFDHSSSGFLLKGSHSKVDCFSCHTKTSDPLLVFQDQNQVEENNCIQCHTDEHDGKYSLDCAKCHNETSFINLNSMDFFDHSIADFHLEGKHQDVDCRKCHTQRFSTPIDFISCNSCHTDYHQGEFTKNEVTPDCIECHSLEEGFEYSLYTIDQHQETNFILDGAHLATPCFACHVSEEENRWTFVDLGVNCKDCHEDEHEASLDATYFKDEAYNCTVCHTNDAWSNLNFDHDLTNWPLDGKHVEVDCKLCHFDAKEDNWNPVFKSLDGQCMSCHENVHDNSFAIDGITDCKRCHVSTSWYPEKFDHSSTAFPLDGKHKDLACSACHESENESGDLVTIYKLGTFECVDCH